jgi:protein O-mannosyl-transferase
MQIISTEKKQTLESRRAWLWLDRCADSHILLALGMVLFTAFANSLFNGFVYDDHILIESNYALRDWNYFTQAFTNSHSYDVTWLNFGSSMVDYYRPFTRMLFALAYHAFGLRTEYWHLLNVVIFCAVVTLAFMIIKQLSGRRFVAAVGALLFAVHPIHSEVVAWVNCLVETLHALFFLGAFVLFLHSEREVDARRGRIFYLGSLTLVAAALLSKETALCFPVLIAAYRFIYVEKSLVGRAGAAFRSALPFLLVVAAYFVLRYFAYGGNLRIVSGLPIETVILTVPRLVLEYIRMLIFPLGLSAVHSVLPVNSLTSLSFWLPLLLLVAIAALIWLRAPRKLAFACAWIIVTLLPVLNIGLFTADLNVQDRYAFLPSLGFCAAVAMALVRLLDSERILPFARQALLVLMVLVAGSLFGLTVRQNGFWHSDLTLFARAAQQNPGSEIAQCNYGSVLYSMDRKEEAARHFTNSFKIRSGESACGCAGLGKYYAGKGDYDQAIQFYESAIELGEGNVNLLVFTDLASAYYYKDQSRKAIRLLDETLAKHPDFKEARYMLEQIKKTQ